MTEKKRRERKENLLGYLVISPWLIGLLVFTFLPMMYSLYLSFTNFDGISTAKWIGLDNYKRMFQDEKFYQSLNVTFTYVVLLVPLRLAFALLVAMLLCSGRKGVEISWIGSPRTALLVLVILGIWQFGASMLIFIAGLKQVPVTYYEAATLDGASAFQRFKSITLPMLSPVIFFNLIMQIINAFKAFNESYIITKGGPLDKTLFYALYIYRQSFEYFNMGYGSALAWILLLIIAVFAIFIFKSSDNWVYYETKGD